VRFVGLFSLQLRTLYWETEGREFCRVWVRFSIEIRVVSRKFVDWMFISSVRVWAGRGVGVVDGKIICWCVWGTGLRFLCLTVDVWEWNFIINSSVQPVDVARNVIWFSLNSVSYISRDFNNVSLSNWRTFNFRIF